MAAPFRKTQWLRIAALWFCTAILALTQTLDACRNPDPTNFDQVFACLSSDRFSNGRPVFASAILPTCDDAAHLYRAALQKSGMPFALAFHWMPSCALLSRALESFTGQPLAWSRCTNYPGVFDPAHMKACLERFLPAHYGGRKSLSSLKGCLDTTREYETALRAATLIGDPTHFHAGLPTSYDKPDCAQIASLFSRPQTSACSDYTPGLPHLQRCLGPEVERFSSCLALRQRYEDKLRQAYGGPLPAFYAPLPCDQLAPFTQAAQARQAALRAHSLQQARERVYARQNAPRPALGPEIASFLSTLFLSWLGGPFFTGLLVHSLMAAWALLYLLRLVQSDDWAGHQDGQAAVAYARLFQWKLTLVHAAVMLVGWWLTRWPWIIGALLARLLNGAALSILIATGRFNLSPRRQPGPVDSDGKVVPIDSKNRKKGSDEGVTEDW
jgi:hypothetical protein